MIATDKTKVRIDPAEWTNAQWAECYYASELLPTDCRGMAQPFEVSPEDARRAGEDCRAKAQRIRRGELGPISDGVVDGVDVEAWARELEEAAWLLGLRFEMTWQDQLEMVASVAACILVVPLWPLICLLWFLRWVLRETWRLCCAISKGVR